MSITCKVMVVGMNMHDRDSHIEAHSVLEGSRVAVVIPEHVARGFQKLYGLDILDAGSMMLRIDVSKDRQTREKYRLNIPQHISTASIHSLSDIIYEGK